MADQRKSSAKDKEAPEGVEFDVPSTHQRYLQSLLEEKEEGERQVAPHLGGVNPTDNPVFTDEGFAGVDPVYQNYANETDAPRQADEGPDALAEEFAEKSVEGGTETSQALREAYDSAYHGGDEEVKERSDVQTVKAGSPVVAEDERENTDNPKSGATGATGATE